MEQLIFFHDHTMSIILVVMVVVGYLLFNAGLMSFYEGGYKGGQEIETVWTVLPVFVLLVIAFPSLRLLYLMEESLEGDITIKVVGRQWYWRYGLPELEVGEFDRYIVGRGGFRLLEVDKRLVLPVLANVRAVVTASDVIHSWAMPRVGVKVDAVPGRLNQVNL